MPKLVIKQDLPEPSTQEKLEGVLRLVLPVLLLVVTAAVALSLYLVREPEATQLVAPASSGFEPPPVYQRQEERLKAMVSEFDAQEREGVDGHDKHAALLDKASQILQQLVEMDGIAEGLGIAAKDKQVLLARNQYQQDYWEAKRVFHDLRLARFMQAAPPAIAGTEPVSASKLSPRQPEVTGGVADNVAQPTSTPVGAAEAKPDLPADFCPLFGPGAAACKPGADEKKP